MSNFMSKQEYYDEVYELARILVSEAMVHYDNDAGQAMDSISDYRLHEVINSHEWIIYNGYNLDVIKHSNNVDYMTDNIGADYILKNSGISGLHQAIAFWALYADVKELLVEKMNDFVDNLE